MRDLVGEFMKGLLAVKVDEEEEDEFLAWCYENNLMWATGDDAFGVRPSQFVERNVYISNPVGRLTIDFSHIFRPAHVINAYIFLLNADTKYEDADISIGDIHDILQ